MKSNVTMYNWLNIWGMLLRMTFSDDKDVLYQTSMSAYDNRANAVSSDFNHISWNLGPLLQNSASHGCGIYLIVELTS